MHTTPGHFLATELIDAKRNGRQFKQPDLAAFIDVNLEAWCQANGYQLAKASETAIAAPLKPELSPAEAIYAAYPRKVGKTAALKSINNAIAQVDKSGPLDGHSCAAHYILERTKAYAAAVALWPARDRQFIPMTTTWFNQGRYLDDTKEWLRGHSSVSNSTARDYSKI